MFMFYVTKPLDIVAEYYTKSGRPLPYTIRFATGAEPDLRVPSSGDAFDTGPRRIRLKPAVDGRVDASRIYFAMSPEFFQSLISFSRRTGESSGVKLLKGPAFDRVLGHPEMPPRLGHYRMLPRPFVPLDAQLARFSGRRRIRLGIINSCGRRFGDMMLAICTIRELHRHLSERFESVEIRLFHHRADVEIDTIFLRSGVVASIQMLPASIRDLARCDGYFDWSAAGLAAGAHWVDSRLVSVGIEPDSVPRERKRFWLPPAPQPPRELVRQVESVKALGRPLLLFHPKSFAKARSFPVGADARFLSELLSRTDLFDGLVVAVVPIDYEHPRFIDWSHLSRTFDDFAYIVSQMDLFISVDTSMYHVADAYGVPGVVIFSTIAPQHRIAYYPSIEGVSLREGEDSRPSVHDDRAALELDADALWGRLDIDDVFAKLERVGGRRIGATLSS